MMKTTPLLLATLGLALVACGQQSLPTGTAQTPAPATAGETPPLLQAQAVGSSVALQVGQTRQINVTVGGTPAQPGQLKWSTSNAGVATVTQSGLITAVAAGTATVRAALASTPSAFLDFPVTVSGTTPAPVPVPTPTPAPAPTPGSGISAAEQRVLDLTNQARATARTCGGTSYPAAPALTWNASLGAAARAHASDMAAKNYFSHTSQDGRTFDTRIVNAGYSSYRALGENIAAGQPTADAVVAGWLTSPGHCANIMSASFKELGVGVGTGGSYGTYWVQDFGARF